MGDLPDRGIGCLMPMTRTAGLRPRITERSSRHLTRAPMARRRVLLAQVTRHDGTWNTSMCLQESPKSSNCDSVTET
eukprot:2018442-Prymnesium_polylepis.1